MDDARALRALLLTLSRELNCEATTDAVIASVQELREARNRDDSMFSALETLQSGAVSEKWLVVDVPGMPKGLVLVKDSGLGSHNLKLALSHFLQSIAQPMTKPVDKLRPVG